MVEKFIDFKMEVSVIASRNTNGEISTYPVVENIHEENILRMTIAPARVSDVVRNKAESIAHKTMEVLKGAGVFGIEMFVKPPPSIRPQSKSSIRLSCSSSEIVLSPT